MESEKVKLSDLNKLEQTKLIVELAEGFINHPLVEISTEESMVMAEEAVKSALGRKFLQNTFYQDTVRELTDW
jgi:hypothetical protein